VNELEMLATPHGSLDVRRRSRALPGGSQAHERRAADVKKGVHGGNIVSPVLKDPDGNALMLHRRYAPTT
jgi:hypothetical protein